MSAFSIPDQPTTDVPSVLQEAGKLGLDIDDEFKTPIPSRVVSEQSSVHPNACNWESSASKDRNKALTPGDNERVSSNPSASDRKIPSKRNSLTTDLQRNSRESISKDRVRAMSKTSEGSYIDRRSVSKMSIRSREDILQAASAQELKVCIEESEGHYFSCHVLHAAMRYMIGTCQKYSIPLALGVVIALIWSNVDQRGYHDFNESQIFGAVVLGHDFTLHFFVNDIFMCFFFGLAAKEVTEALLPGGSLNPLRRAINPLFATVGGVIGPIAVYLLCISLMYTAGAFDSTDCSEGASSSHRRLGANSSTIGHDDNVGECTFAKLAKGWGVPTATDISLAWMFSLIIFGRGHPAINFMLLLAILDDAIGMVIIAVFYSDPAHPVDPVWLLLVVVAMAVAYAMRRCKVTIWTGYIAVCGPVSWLGLIKAHVHPALALVFVVPLMPASHAIVANSDECNLGACDLGPLDEPGRRPSTSSDTSAQSGTQSFAGRMKRISSRVFGLDEEAPLHTFELHAKKPVDFGMFFFGLANAGVPFQSVGSLTGAILISLILGKMVGIFVFSVAAHALGFGLPFGLGFGDLLAMSALAGIGLTVALFLANEAFIQPELRDQAKMGAVLSVGAVLIAGPIRKLIGGAADEDCVCITAEATVIEVIDVDAKLEVTESVIEVIDNRNDQHHVDAP